MFTLAQYRFNLLESDQDGAPGRVILRGKRGYFDPSRGSVSTQTGDNARLEKVDAAASLPYAPDYKRGMFVEVIPPAANAPTEMYKIINIAPTLINVPQRKIDLQLERYVR